MQNLPSSIYKYKLQSNELIFMNGSEIVFKDLFAYPSDPNFDELGSLELTGAYIDEAVQVSDKAKNIVRSRIRFKLDENNLIPKSLYTSNPGKGWLYSEFYQQDKKNELADNKKFVQSLLSDNPFISEFYEQNLKTLDRESKERLLYGNWDYHAEGLVFPEFKLKRFKDVDLKDSEVVAYCDVADQGIDSLCFVIAALIGENIFIIDVLFTRKDSNYTIPKIISLFEKYNISKAIFESNNQGLMYTKLLKTELSNKYQIAAKPNTTMKHSRIVVQSGFIMDHFYFKDTEDVMYNDYLTELTSYREDKKSKHDDSPDATAGLSRFIRKVILK